MTRSTSSALLFAIVAVAAMPPLVAAQVAVHQGDITKEDPKQFASPMIVDVPLRHLDALADGQGLTFLELRGYYCEDATITRLALAKRRATQKDSSGTPFSRFEISGDVAVRASFDRFVTLDFSLVAGGSALGSSRLSRMSVEEKQHRSFKVFIELSPAAIAKIRAADAEPSLRVAVIVASNK